VRGKGVKSVTSGSIVFLWKLRGSGRHQRYKDIGLGWDKCASTDSSFAYSCSITNQTERVVGVAWIDYGGIQGRGWSFLGRSMVVLVLDCCAGLRLKMKIRVVVFLVVQVVQVCLRLRLRKCCWLVRSAQM
jgi:hypothetical protein